MDTSAVPHLSLAGAHPLALVDGFDVGPGLEPVQEDVGLLGLGVTLDLVGNDEGDLRDPLNAVTLGHNESRDAGSGDGGAEGVALLGYVDPAVPSAEGLGGGEHVTATAHVAERTLARTVSTTTADTGNTGDGTTGTPGFGGRLMSYRR